MANFYQNLHFLKPRIQRFLRSRFPPILVASMGRSGSTLVFEGVSEGMARARFGMFAPIGKKIVRDTAWDPGDKDIHKGVVYKTHALPEEVSDNKEVKVIFVFGRASDAALSVLSCRKRFGEEWLSQHWGHMRGFGSPDDICNADVLRFTEQLSGWREQSDRPRLLIKYDALWENQERISKFCGFKVKLPPKRPRAPPSHIDAGVIKKVKETYAALDEEIDNLPGAELLI